MSPFAIVVLAFSMTVDSYLAAMGWGAGRHRLALGDVVRTGLLFAVVQMATPLIGWFGGYMASSFVAPVDHWLAFGLLTFVGGRMVYVALFEDCDFAEAGRGRAVGPLDLFMTAVGTSIDALAVGVSLAFLDVNIFTVTLAIGGATFVMTVGGLLAGRMLKCRLGRYAEVLAGLVLIALGVGILVRHIWGV